jgi:MFS family permease
MRPFKGIAGLILAVAVVALVFVAWPAYRWFFLISAGIGIAVAAILYFWHRFKPIKEAEVDHKRPLGLN